MSSAPGVGLVGAGAFGRFCAEAFAAMPELRLAAVADVDRERASALAARFDAAVYGGLAELLTDPSVAIVALNTPPWLHAEQGLEVLRAGRHLFCEKPLALDLPGAEALIREAGARGLYLTINYVMRHNPFWQAAARLAASGLTGALRHMDLANYAAGLELPAAHWFWDKSRSGGIWVEHGVHFFDAFAWVAGAEGQVLAAQSCRRADGVVDRVEALARFGDAAAHFYHGFDRSGRSEHTTVRLAFADADMVLREWVPTSLEIITGAPQELLPHLPPDLPQTMEACGEHWRLRCHDPRGKSVVYRESIQAGMRDLVQTLHDPQHTMAVQPAHGLASLQMALTAEAVGA